MLAVSQRPSSSLPTLHRVAMDEGTVNPASISQCKLRPAPRRLRRTPQPNRRDMPCDTSPHAGRLCDSATAACRLSRSHARGRPYAGTRADDALIYSYHHLTQSPLAAESARSEAQQRAFGRRRRWYVHIVQHCYHSQRPDRVFPGTVNGVLPAESAASHSSDAVVLAHVVLTCSQMTPRPLPTRLPN